MNLDPETADAVQEEIDALCREHGNTWPSGAAADLIRRFATSRTTIYQRKLLTMVQLAGLQEVA